MSKRTALNDVYKGLVEEFQIPAEIEDKDGRKVARFGSAVPIHTCSPDEIEQYAEKTHHYCDIFSEQPLAPLDELVYVRLDDNMAEKVFINRTKRILLHSSDGRLALWRCAPTFESANLYLPGTPLVDKGGRLVSVLTAKRGNHYAVSTFEGEGGYFETGSPWLVREEVVEGSVYGGETFRTREELREHVAGLPSLVVDETRPPVPVLYRGTPSPRVVLMAQGGRQISHSYLQGVMADEVEYL